MQIGMVQSQAVMIATNEMFLILSIVFAHGGRGSMAGSETKHTVDV